MDQRRFKRVAVLMGGPSSEREVSLRSGAAVARGLAQAGYDVESVDLQGPPLRLPPGVEAVFIALHGAYGEDGQIQAELDRMGMPYVGAGARASEAAMDKVVTKRLLEAAGVATPAWAAVAPGDAIPLPLPLVVKPTREGSSVGISLVFDAGAWPAAVADASRFGAVMAEAYVPGRELTIGVVGDQALPVIEIVAPADGWYTYANKYTKGACRYICPADLPADVEHRCRNLAWRTFEVLGCRGMGRVDLRLRPDGEAFVLELNTIPGFTETSLLPKAAAAAGIGFSALCDRILNLARTG
jgi:D-alanine-D-alanine ligase